MERYIKSGGAGAAPAPDAGATAEFPTSGNAGTGTPASVPGPYWFHMITEELRQVITDGGLVPDAATLNQLSAAIQALIKAAPAALQPGDIIICPNGSPRAGTLELNGALINRVTYADLWAYANGSSNITDDATQQASQWGSFSTGDLATTFRLPDLRGEFLRGWDNGRGIDVGRLMGVWQTATTIDPQAVYPGGSSSYESIYINDHDSLSAAYTQANHQVDLSSLSQQTTGQTSNFKSVRPRNLPFMFCIKY
jgi:microcystin-dependent protein